jgi:hypothetical protein
MMNFLNSGILQNRTYLKFEMGGASNYTGEIFKKVIIITANRPIKKDFFP